MIDKRYQVFISSTYSDLKEARQKVIQTVMELDCIPSGMELFPAIDQEQFEFIKRIIDDCDYYIVIIGNRYGSLSDEGISYTEMEYDYAIQKEKKVIGILHANPQEISVKNSDISEKLIEKLELFKSKVKKGRLVRFWSNADELPGIVALSLSRTIKMYPSNGWIRGDKVADFDNISQILKQSIEKRNPYDLGVQEIFANRQSFTNYFKEITLEARESIDSVLVTGGFIPGVDLDSIIRAMNNVQFNFYLCNPESINIKKRANEVQDLYGVGAEGDGYFEIKHASEKYDNVSLKYYDSYPYWHYIRIDSNIIYVSFNPLGSVGFQIAPVLKCIDNGNEVCAFRFFNEHIREIKYHSVIKV